MNLTTKKALAVAVNAFDSEESDSPSVDLTGKQRDLLSRLAAITEMIKQHRATILLLERERMQVTTKLRLTGHRAPVEQDSEG